MLNNKWIISDKQTSSDHNHFLYTMILVDCEYGPFKKDVIYRDSDKNLTVGAFVDYNLNPIENQYKYSNTEIATVEAATVFNVGKYDDFKRVALFGENTGCFDIFVQKSTSEFSIHRGDVISVFKFINKNKKEIIIKMMHNLTTGDISPNYDYVLNNCNGKFEDVIVTGIGAAGVNKEPSKKHLLIHSEKFGYMSSVVSSLDIMFFTRQGDKLLVEKQPRKSTFNVLRNITVDNMRTAFLLQRE